MSLGIIVPTIGRPSLVRTLTSITTQPLEADDVIMVVGQGPAIAATAAEWGAVFLTCPPGRHGGAEERMVALRQATTTHLAFLDDDDAWVPGARARIHVAIAATPDRPLIFRMQYSNGRTLWRDPVVRCGNVGTPMIVVPNVRTKLGVWPSRRKNDFYFLSSLHWPAREIVWHTDVIAHIGPTPIGGIA